MNIKETLKQLNFKERVLEVIILMIGLVIAHFGVTLFLLAELGTDPFNVFVQGIFRTLGRLTGWSFLTHGRTHMVLCFIIIISLLFIDKSYVRIGTILCMIFGGPIIDIFNALLGPLFSGEISLAARIVVNAAGCIILAYGMTIVIKSEAGTGPNDLVAIVLADKLKKKFSLVRIIVDLFFALAGFALGGTLGLGTVICAFLVGPAAGVFLPINGRIISKIKEQTLK